MGSPLFADAPATPPAAGSGEGSLVNISPITRTTWGPFSPKTPTIFSRLGVPVVMGMMWWVTVLTMLIGWGVDVLMSRGFAFFYAPAFADVKRSLIYATGSLFLSLVYTGILSLAVIFSLKFSFVFIAMGIAVFLLVAVSLAAQLVWILYLYRTTVSVSIVFYAAILVAHAVLGVVIAKSVIGMKATSVVTDFMDQSVTPRLQAETESIRQQLATAQSDRNDTKSKYTELQQQITQAKADEVQLHDDIEAKKNSDIYVYSRIVQAHARGELVSARDQLAAFLTKFPTSSLVSAAQLQQTQIRDELTLQSAQKKQADADAAVATAQAKADLLARAGKGQVTLSEMRHALIGKSRAQVSGLLGMPAQTSTDNWSYVQQMIFNPLTNEKFGLLVYFSEGSVQSVDYNRIAASQ